MGRTGWFVPVVRYLYFLSNEEVGESGLNNAVLKVKTQLAYRQNPLRFRRWSRKRYAAFVSVQRAVTIGHLAASVSERLQVKNTSVHTFAFLREWTAWNEGRGEVDSGGEEKLEIDSLLFHCDPQVCLNPSGEKAAASHLNKYLFCRKHERYSVYGTEAFRASFLYKFDLYDRRT